MPYISAVLGRVHLLRWLTPTFADVDTVIREIVSTHKSAGRPLVCLGIISDKIPPPDDRTRQAMVNSMEEIIARSEVVHFVVEGSGFKNSIMRSIVSGVLIVGGKRGKAIVHSTVPQAIAAFPPDLDKRLITLKAEQVGIIQQDMK